MLRTLLDKTFLKKAGNFHLWVFPLKLLLKGEKGLCCLQLVRALFSVALLHKQNAFGSK